MAPAGQRVNDGADAGIGEARQVRCLHAEYTARESLTATETIVFFDNDLTLPDQSDVVRIVVVKWTYNSSLGSDLQGASSSASSSSR
jgi:hypothetical protein